MKVHAIPGNTQRLDGGSLFGNCPRPVWERWLAPDDRGRIETACRALLVQEEGGRNVLLETGIGTFFEPGLRDRYGVDEEEHFLLTNLGARGVRAQDIAVVVLSHLHFDHAGGLLTAWREGENPELVFPEAQYVVGRSAWERAQHPHPRDRASFIPGLCEMLDATGRLEIVEERRSEVLGEGYHFSVSDGHTPGQLHTRVETKAGPLRFAGDLVPGVPWVHLPITMGYDRFPELLIDEKRAFLDEVMAESGWLFLTHDPEVAACRVARDEKGRYRAVEPQRDLAALNRATRSPHSSSDED